MKAVVTGGAGFIGSHLARRLLDEGWSVLILDDLSSGAEGNLPDGAEFIEVDVTAPEAASGLSAEHVDVVFHLASKVGQELSFEQPVEDLRVNALASAALLEWCAHAGVTQLVFASSMCVYGDPLDQPVTEATPVDPKSPYAVGKLASEQLCRVYQRVGRVNTTILRLFNVYGPGQDLANLKQGMASIYLSYVVRDEPILVCGSAERFRDLISVHDVVDAFYRCVDVRAYGKTYNVATGRKTLVRELVDEIVRACGHEAGEYTVTYGESTPGDAFGVFGDSTALRGDLAWEPRVGLSEGIAEMAQWALATVSR
jgi:UDP-glucose 4-epimerase